MRAIDPLITNQVLYQLSYGGPRTAAFATLCASAKAGHSPLCGLPAAIEMANADGWLLRGVAERGAWLGLQFGDEHELLGLSFPRHFRQSRLAPNISAATTAAACATTAATAHAASPTARDATGAAACHAASAATSNAANAAACDTAGAATGHAARAAAAGAATAVRPADQLLARRLARAGRDARPGLRSRRVGAALRRRRKRCESNSAR
jgi:hypothetical protein